MNEDSHFETLSDISLEVLASSSGVREQAGGGSELGLLMQRLHNAIETSARRERAINQIVLLSMIDQLKAIKSTAEMLVDHVPKKDVYAMIEAIDKARCVVSDAWAHVVHPKR